MLAHSVNRITNGATPGARGVESAALPLDRLMARPSPLDRIAAPASYTVRPGDTLSEIADRFGMDWRALARANGLTDPDRIMPGQQLRLVGGERASYTVRAGDTLSEIATAHGTSWQSLARLNGLRDPDRITPGQVLRLTDAAPASRAASPRTERADGPAAAPGPRPAGDHRIGGVSERYESGGRGPGTVSTGRGDPGGVSYGVYQLSSNAGTLQNFLRNEGRAWAGELGGGLGGAAFNERWRAVAARDPDGFRAAQHAFIERTHYRPAVDGVRAATGLDLSARHAAVREATWSSSVQHGGAERILSAAVRRTDAEVGRGTADYDRRLVSNIYAERTAYVRELARTGDYSSGERRQLISITENRYPNERRDVLALFDRALRADAPAAARGPAPAEGRPADARTAADYAAIVNDRGDARARADLAAGRKVVVAIRQDTSTGANRGQGVYDDRMAMVWRRPDGSYAARTFTGNTDPAGKYEARGYGVDLDRDGRRELGRLNVGNHRYVLQPGQFAGDRYFRTTETQVVARDTNHDGRFTAADGVDPRGAGRSMYFHQGGNSTTGSAGCQTLRPADYDAFLSGLGRQTSFSYVLVNAGR